MWKLRNSYFLIVAATAIVLIFVPIDSYACSQYVPASKGLYLPILFILLSIILQFHTLRFYCQKPGIYLKLAIAISLVGLGYLSVAGDLIKYVDQGYGGMCGPNFYQSTVFLLLVSFFTWLILFGVNRVRKPIH